MVLSLEQFEIIEEYIKNNPNSRGHFSRFESTQKILKQTEKKIKKNKLLKLISQYAAAKPFIN
jgi:hypothetical protein